MIRITGGATTVANSETSKTGILNREKQSIWPIMVHCTSLISSTAALRFIPDHTFNTDACSMACQPINQYRKCL